MLSYKQHKFIAMNILEKLGVGDTADVVRNQALKDTTDYSAAKAVCYRSAGKVVYGSGHPQARSAALPVTQYARVKYIWYFIK